MDIIAASNIGMTNANKNKKKSAKKTKIPSSKLYILAEIKYIVGGVVGNNTIIIQICNEKTLIDLAKDYYIERKLRSNRKWEKININRMKPQDAIQILTKRKYAKIQEITEDIIGRMLMDNKIAHLISVNDKL